MLEYLSVLKKSPLFQGASEKEIEQMLPCLQARSHMVRKGDFVLRQGQPVNGLMILAKGCLHMQRDDYWGNRSILTTVNPGELFGAAYFAPENSTALHDVKAVEDSVVVCFDVKKLLSVCPSACRFHTMAVQNLFFAVSGKNRKLLQKLDHLSKRSTREKLLSYLSAESARQGSANFTIPFSRQQLADYLSVDRSAMSRELCRLQKEGLLSFDRNHFSLH